MANKYGKIEHSCLAKFSSFRVGETEQRIFCLAQKVRWNGPLWSISSTFYARIFVAFFYLHVTIEKLPKKFCTKNAHVKCWWNWHHGTLWQTWSISIINGHDRDHISSVNQLATTNLKLGYELAGQDLSSTLMRTSLICPFLLFFRQYRRSCI